MTILIITLYLAVLAFSCGLHYLNNRHLKQHGHEIPSGFEGVIDPGGLAKSSDYSLAKGQVSLLQSLFDSTLTLLFVFGVSWRGTTAGWLAMVCRSSPPGSPSSSSCR